MFMPTGNVRYFEPWEFERQGRQWWNDLSPRLLIMLDVLRHRWGKPIHISDDLYAIGRRLGQRGTSQHNIDHYGEVRAVDIKPDGIANKEDAYAFCLLAMELGFTGVGWYVWNDSWFAHVDVRHDRQPGYPATWGEVLVDGNRTRVSMNDALEAMPE